MIYLDNAATTEPSPDVLESMKPYLSYEYGNPGSIHYLGVRAAKAVSKARCQVAEFLGAKPDNIIFTSGGTEANNMVFAGLKDHLIKNGKTHIIISAIEHDSVINSAKMLIKDGFYITFLPVTRQGKIELSMLEDSITDKTGLISIMYVNNEIGSINDVSEIGKICKRHGVLFHTDCVQAAGFETINIEDIQCDFASISSHKIHGCKGVGALYIRDKSILTPIIHGGIEQEYGLRGGTENVPGIVGFGVACERANNNIQWTKDIVSDLNKVFLTELSSHLSDSGISEIFHINSQDANNKICNIRFDDIDAQTLIIMLSSLRVFVSAGSACRAHENEPSRVLLSIGLTDKEARESVRVSFSDRNTPGQAIRAAELIYKCVVSIREKCTGGV